jgi:cyclin L
MSVVDRSVVPILPTPDPDDTPSRRNGVAADVERSHRLYGTCLLAAATRLEKLTASTYASACTIFHRFYHRASLTQYSVWSVAMGSLLLATKIEDGPQQRTIRSIVLVFDHLYRKRRCAAALQPQVLPMPKLGPVWKEYYDHVLEMENQILRELGFTLYWIPDSHPHKFLWEFLRLLFGLPLLEPAPILDTSTTTIALETAAAAAATAESMDTNTKQEEKPNPEKETRHYELAQRAWNYCNDSCRLDLCVRYDSEVIVSLVGDMVLLAGLSFVEVASLDCSLIRTYSSCSGTDLFNHLLGGN